MKDSVFGPGLVDPRGDPQRREQLLNTEQQFFGAAAQPDVAGALDFVVDGAAIGVEKATEEPITVSSGASKIASGTIFSLRGRGDTEGPEELNDVALPDRSCRVPLA